MDIFVQRNGAVFGPYPHGLVQRYLDEGSLLANDLARDAAVPSIEWKALSQILASAGTRVRRRGLTQSLRQTVDAFRSFDLNLLFPWKEITSLRCMKNSRLIYFALIGLGPAIALTIAPGIWISYWAIAIYFSVLWALFFYSFFKTPQVIKKYCFLCFFFTGIVSITVMLLLQQLPLAAGVLAMTESTVLPVRALGMFLGVGIPEELCKAAILFWLVGRPGQILVPQTVVFYGLISGLGFGIYEGVSYQLMVNREQGVDTAYFLNIARLTSLPFLHAIWTGIAGYFLSFAVLYPNKKWALSIVAILIPALFHAIYNTFGWGFVGLGAAMLSVIFLMSYLSNCREIQKSLRVP